MKDGHKVYKFNYNTPSINIVTIKINNVIVEISISNTNKIESDLQIFITLGNFSSTTGIYKKQIDDKIG